MPKGFLITKKEELRRKKNRGYIRLLKRLEREWPVVISISRLSNQYQCFENDFKYLEEQGLVFCEKVDEDKYYKLGFKGFEYLELRRFNTFMWMVGIATLINVVISVIMLCKL